MHVRPGGDSHSSPSPRNSDWLSAEPSSQSHLRRAARSSLAAYLRTMVCNIFLERYVDNRFVIFPSPASGHPAAPLEALLHADFYGAPIVLEQVGSSEFLGFVIDVGDRAIYYKTPTKIWQIRGPHTAGSLSTLLSGARSRSALATKYAHPARAVQMALDQLRSIYLSAGYKSADLQHLFHLPAIPTGKNVYVLIVVVSRDSTVWLLLVLLCSVLWAVALGFSVWVPGAP